MKTSNFETTLVDTFTIAYVGGTGSFDDLAAHFINAIEQYNYANGTNLIFGMEETP